MSEVDWGPKRPAAVSWAGVLLFLAGTVQLVAIGTALLLDAPALLGDWAFAVATVFGVVFALLQIVAAVGVIRLGRGWRMFGMVLSAIGAALHAQNIVAAGGDTVLIWTNGGFLAAYALIFVLLLRTRPAFG